jgi:hypothetical protein
MSTVAWLALVVVAALFATGLIGAVQICRELTEDEHAEGRFQLSEPVSERRPGARHRRSSLRTGGLSVGAVILLLTVVSPAHADPAIEAPQHCAVSTQEQARQLADVLFGQGAYQRAGECYQAAGQLALADKAFLKAVGPESAATARQLSDQRDQAKALLHKVQQAFRSDH